LPPGADHKDLSRALQGKPYAGIVDARKTIDGESRIISFVGWDPGVLALQLRLPIMGS
jgi:hypothetical protein